MTKKQYEKVLSLIESRIAITRHNIEDIETGKVEGCLECRKADLEEFEAYRAAIVKKPKSGVYAKVGELTHEQRDFICSHESKCYGCRMAKLGGCIMYDETKKNRSIRLPEGCPGTPEHKAQQKQSESQQKQSQKDNVAGIVTR